MTHFGGKAQSQRRMPLRFENFLGSAQTAPAVEIEAIVQDLKFYG
jgi:hypothetical protein